MNTQDAAAVVQRQLDAYNARDVEAILATYAEDAEQFEHPAKLLACGVAQLRERFVARFQEPNLHAALLNRVVMGNVVVDHEKVTRSFPEGTGHIGLVAIYEVQGGKFSMRSREEDSSIKPVRAHECFHPLLCSCRPSPSAHALGVRLVAPHARAAHGS
jgi:hypothetical protein